MQLIFITMIYVYFHLQSEYVLLMPSLTRDVPKIDSILFAFNLIFTTAIIDDIVKRTKLGKEEEPRNRMEENRQH